MENASWWDEERSGQGDDEIGYGGWSREGGFGWVGEVFWEMRWGGGSGMGVVMQRDFVGWNSHG